eukprot:m.70754 g.70754  ORF g.70754 m.70754 type:complete len:533 (+) comp12268_c0_seq1:32-1630(+)
MATKKQQKYDRQLRLWGDHGQARLEGAHVGIIGASPLGTEILKNLVLPGVGQFTLIDSATVAAQDLGNNFFFETEDIGKNRAKAATALLCEMNPDVIGNYNDKDVETLLDDDPVFFQHFTVVVATQLKESLLLRLATLLAQYNIPLLASSINGMMGYLRLVVKDHTIVESHPHDQLNDLRLAAPFEELTQHIASIDLDTMTPKEHSHVPYPIIIAKCLEKYIATEGEAAMPKDSKSKRLFKKYLMTQRLQTEEGALKDEPNFSEAAKEINTALNKPRIPDDVQEVLSDPKCTTLTKDSSDFWIMAHALKKFVENQGQGMLPVRGTIPDMHSDSDSYIQLQQVYRNAAARDAAVVMGIVEELLVSLCEPESRISKDTVTEFCKKASELRMVSTTLLEDEYIKGASAAVIESELEAGEEMQSDMVWYILFRAANKFAATHGHFPGAFEKFEEDIPHYSQAVATVLSDLGVSATIDSDLICEFCRFGGSQLHSTAAYVAGVASQEVVKLLTQQYVPFNNTLIYNGVRGSVSTFKL